MTANPLTQSPTDRNRFREIDHAFANQIKREFGCPVYVLDEVGIRKRFSELLASAQACYPNSAVAVSYKTNPTRGMLKQLHQDGALAEVVSGDELRIARSLNVPTDRIVFNGPCKSDEDLALAIEGGCFIHCDHGDEVDRIEAIAARMERVANVGIRLYFASEDSWERFGFACDGSIESHAHQIARRIVISQYLRLTGIHTHIGTNVRRLEKFRTLGQQLSRFAEFLVRDLSVNLLWVDVGGGLAGAAPLVAENRFEAHRLPPADDYCRAIIGPLLPVLNALPSPPRLLFEPGRTLFNAFGALLVSVVGRRPAGRDGIPGVILDAGITSLAFAQKYNHPIHVCKPGPMAEPIRFWGPTCMEQDQIHQPMPMPTLNVGDLLVIYGTGAYSMAMACSFTHFRLGVVGWGQGLDLHWLRRPETIDHSSRLDEL